MINNGIVAQKMRKREEKGCCSLDSKTLAVLLHKKVILGEWADPICEAKLKMSL